VSFTIGLLLIVVLTQFAATQSDFPRAIEPRAFSFPADHGSHPAYRTEWWYLTGELTTEAGEKLGYQATWFRSALRPQPARRASRLAVRDLYFFHGALARPEADAFVHDHAVSRAGAGWAGAATDRLHLFLPRHTLEQRADGVWRLEVRVKARRMSLRLTPTRPPLLHGRTPGLSIKGPEPGQASYYYSHTRMETEGTLQLEPGGAAVRVTGRTWFDHEFGSAQLAADHEGWDWFSTALSDGTDLMVYGIRRKDGTLEPKSSGTIRFVDGRRVHLARHDFRIEPLARWKSEKSGATYPARWRLTVPGARIDLEVTPLLPDQELHTPGTTGITYWEGFCRFIGRVGDREVEGRGYVELVGYAGPFRAGI
jgi:predicted secreted hydrolase